MNVLVFWRDGIIGRISRNGAKTPQEKIGWRKIGAPS
jgi:hypothetical protein